MMLYQLITAAGCRHILKSNDVVRNKVAKAINEAVAMGHYNVCLRMTLNNDLINELISMGYDVSTDHDERTETLTHISWK